MSKSFVHLGYEVGSGKPCEIPVLNMAVTGQTQQSGKTTTLEALVERSGVTALTFVTKRGEQSFAEGRRVQPYFRERADWQFVDQLLSAQLQEKNRPLRPFLVRLCQSTRTLQDVQSAVRRALKKAKTGYAADIYTVLEAYLDLIVPEIDRADLATTLHLKPGLNVMDVSAAPLPMQMLLVQSAIDWVNEKEQNTVVVIPEAWEFVPEGKGSPVKASATTLVRKGSALGNHIWLDSQDMAGVDKVLLRGCPVWLIGVQRESNEIRRNLANIPDSVSKPKPKDVATLERGQFYACWGSHAVRTYVQPKWMSGVAAQGIALGERTIPTTPPPRRDPPEDAVNEREAQALRDENQQLRDQIADLERQLQALSSSEKVAAQASRSGHRDNGESASAVASAPATHSNGTRPGIIDEGVYQALKARLISELPQDPSVLRIVTAKPQLRVEVERQIITIDGRSTRGRIARLIAAGFFEAAKTSSDILAELERTGSKPSNIEFGNEMKGLVEMGFFTRSNKWYALVPDMVVNVVEAR